MSRNVTWNLTVHSFVGTETRVRDSRCVKDEQEFEVSMEHCGKSRSRRKFHKTPPKWYLEPTSEDSTGHTFPEISRDTPNIAQNYNCFMSTPPGSIFNAWWFSMLQKARAMLEYYVVMMFK